MRNKIIILGLFVTFFIMVFAGCTDKKLDAENGNSLEGLMYKSTDFNPNFGLNYPEGWTVDENDQFGPVRFYGETINGFQINLGLSEPTSLDSETLISTATQMEETYPTLFTNYSHISSDTLKINGMDSYELIYTFSQGVYDLKGKQVLIENNDIIYIFTFTAGINSFDDYMDVVEESLNSFKVA